MESAYFKKHHNHCKLSTVVLQKETYLIESRASCLKILFSVAIILSPSREIAPLRTSNE